MRICEWRYDPARYPALRTYIYWMDERGQIWCYPQYADDPFPSDHRVPLTEAQMDATTILTRFDVDDPRMTVRGGL